MKNNKTKIRSHILTALVIILPILFSLYSPVLLSIGIRNGIITASFLVFATWFVLSLFIGRSAFWGYTCPYRALQEILGRHILNKKPKYIKADKIKYFVFMLFFLMVSYFILKTGGLKGVDLFASSSNPQIVILIPAFSITVGLLSIIFGSRSFAGIYAPKGFS